PLAEAFKPNATGKPCSAGYTRVPYWFRVEVPDEAAEGEWLLELEYPLLDFVDLYVPRADGGFQHIETGDQRPFMTRMLQHRNLVEPLRLEAGAARTLYLRVSTQSSLNLAMHLWSPHAFIEKSQAEQYLLGL